MFVMRRYAIALLAVAAVAAVAVAAFKKNMVVPPAPDVKSLHDFTMKDIDGKNVKLDKYKGKVVMVVNVASKCGLTPQYEALQALYAKYKEKGLVILGFPANDFGSQEPGTEAEIKQFCSSKYNVTFPMFSKITVVGDKMNPLYSWLINSTPNAKADAIEWNFAKFLVGKDGRPLARFGSRTKPDDAAVVKAIEAALK